MKTYAYRAVTATGDVQAGWLDALNPVDLEVRLKYLGLDLISAKPSLKHRNRLFFAYDGFRHLNWLCLNLHRLLTHGLSLPQALADLRDLATSPAIREACANLLEGIFAGQSLAIALQRSPNVFDTVFVAIIGLGGQQRDRIIDMLSKLADYAQALDFAAQLKRYLWLCPIALLATGFWALCALLIISFPQSLTSLFLSVGSMTGLLIFLVMALLLFGLCCFGRSKIRRTIEWLEMHWPAQRNVLAFQFLLAFVVLYKAGVEPIDAIDTANKSSRNRHMSKIVEAARNRLLRGVTLDKALDRTALFPSAIARIIQSGQARGVVGDMLAVSCDLLEHRLTMTLSKAKRCLLLLSILSAVCLAIVIVGLTRWDAWHMAFAVH